MDNCASKEPGEPNHAGNSGGDSIWFSWRPTSNQTAVITTKGSGFDTLLAVYTGNTVSSLSCVASNDDIIPGVYVQSALSFAATAGTTYHIVIDGYNGAYGPAVLNINPPGNDDFASAFIISGASGATTGYTIGASKESGEPAHAGDVGGHSIWYRWTAPTSGPVDFNTAGSTFNTTLAVYTGSSVTNLTVIAGNNDDAAGLHTSRVDFQATAGTTYRIAVDGFGGDAGNVALSWNMNSSVSIARRTGGAVEIDFTGVNGQKYGLLVSSNLATWFTQAIRTMSGSKQQYIDNAAVPQRFYRTVLVP